MKSRFVLVTVSVMSVVGCRRSEPPPSNPAPVAGPATALVIAPLARTAGTASSSEKAEEPREEHVVLTLDPNAPNAWSGAHANAPVSPTGIWGDGKNVFAVGPGMILRSKDRGVHWTKTSGPGDWPVVWGASIDDLYAAGRGAVRSTDRGETWTSAGRLPGVAYGLWGSGPNDIWAVGGSPTFVSRSGDHGATWTSSALDEKRAPSWLYAVVGSGPDDVWIGGKRQGAKGTEAVLYRTTDRGKSFVSVRPPAPGTTDNEQIRKLCFTSTGALFVAMTYSLHVTRDKGKSWKLATGVGTEVLALACKDTEILVGGRNHEVRMSKDDGASFQDGGIEPSIDGRYVAAQAAFIAPSGEYYLGLESYDLAKGKGTLLRREP